MKTRTILVLAATLVVLAIVYYFDSRSRLRRLESQVSQEDLVSMPTAEIDMIAFRNRHAEIRLEKRDDAWHMAAPLDAPADNARVVERILPQLEAAQKYGEFSAPQKDLSRFGLTDPDVLEVALGNAASRRSEQIAFGSATPLKGECYVTGEPGRIFVTRTDVRDLFSHPLVDYLDRSVPGLDAQALGAIAIEPLESPRAPLAVRRGESGDWTLTQAAPGAPEGMVCDARMIEDILSGLESLRASDYVSSGAAAVATYGLDHPMLRLRAQGKDGAELAFLIGEPVLPPDKARQLKPGEAAGAEMFQRYAALEGGRLVFPVGQALAKALGRAPDEYRDRRIFTLAPEEVCYLQIETRVGPIDHAAALIREPGGEWRLTDDPAAPVNQERVNTYVKLAVSLRVESWTPPTPTSPTLQTGLDAPELRLTMRGPDVDTREGLEVGDTYAARDALRFARLAAKRATGDESELFGIQLPDKYLLLLKRTGRYFKQRSLLQIDPEAVGRVEVFIDGSQGSTTVTLQRAQGGPAPWEGKLGALDMRAVPESVTEPFFLVLQNLEYQVAVEAESISDQMLRLAGLDKPAVTFRFFDRSGRRIAGLAIGMPEEQGQMLMCHGDDDQYYYVRIEYLQRLSAALQQIVGRLQ